MTLEPPANPYNYFVGYIPPGLNFHTKTYLLERIITTSGTPSANLCMLGLLTYFEAFFKDQFAAIVNIEPKILENLPAKDYDIRIDALDFVKMGGNYDFELGSMVAENYTRFGEPKGINSIYFALLKVIPFSSDEITHHEKLLIDRNILVHSGGTITLKYAKQLYGAKISEQLRFQKTLDITDSAFRETVSFCEQIVEKTIKSTRDALIKYINKNNIELSKDNKAAIDLLDFRIRLPMLKIK